MTHDETNRLKVLWKKGRHMFMAFCTGLEGIQKEMNDKQMFVDFCEKELGLTQGTIALTSRIFEKADGARIRKEFAIARAFSRQQKREEQRVREAEKEQLKAAKEKEDKRKKKNAANRKSRKKKKEEATRCVLAAATVQ